MSGPEKKPRRCSKPKLSAQIEPEDRAALDAVAALMRQKMPALGDHVLSITMRGALRIGLAVLLREPERLLLARTPDVGEVL